MIWLWSNDIEHTQLYSPQMRGSCVPTWPWKHDQYLNLYA